MNEIQLSMSEAVTGEKASEKLKTRTENFFVGGCRTAPRERTRSLVVFRRCGIGRRSTVNSSRP
jgi:hypothetical protein